MSGNNDDVIKVSGSSNPSSVGSILARAVVAGESPNEGYWRFRCEPSL